MRGTALASQRVDELLAQAAPYVREVAAWFGRQAGSIGLVLVQFLLTVVLCAVLYAGGESWAAWVRRFSRRLAGDRGDRVTVLAGQAIQWVALGVVVTAILQSLLGAIGLAIAGVPFVSVLAAVMFVLCIAQIGPILVLLAATAWVYATRYGVGNIPTRLVARRRAHGQFPAPNTDQEGSRPAIPAHFRRGGRWAGRVRRGGYIRRARRAGSRLHLLDDWVAEERDGLTESAS